VANQCLSPTSAETDLPFAIQLPVLNTAIDIRECDGNAVVTRKGTCIALLACIHKHRFHHKAAKSAKCLIVFVKEFLCVLCGFAALRLCGFAVNLNLYGWRWLIRRL
jgi:hypothetical protein